MSFISTLWEWLSKDRIRDWAFHWSFRLSIWGKSSLDLFYCVYKHIRNLREVSSHWQRTSICHVSLMTSIIIPPDLLVPATRGVVLVYHLGSRLSVPFQFSVFNFYFSPSGLKIRLTSKYFSWKDIVINYNYLVLSIRERSYPRLCCDQVGRGSVTNHDFIHRNWN